ncbi:MAG: hypothetical protein ACI8W7_002274, partial [Gammaproteobacteria bacterium]
MVDYLGADNDGVNDAVWRHHVVSRTGACTGCGRDNGTCDATRANFRVLLESSRL